jgi:DNA-binding MarR family transcriptional regulator
MTTNSTLPEPAATQRLARLAEFRFQLRRFLSFSEVESERFGIAAQQYQLMQVIGALPPGESATISYLAERMVLRHNSTVELVDRAERAGLVRRDSDERDLRRSLVSLTAHGRSVLDRMILSHLEQLEGDAGAQILKSLQALRGESAADVPTPSID